MNSRFIIVLATVLCFIPFLNGCADFGTTPVQLTGMRGQVYSIATPGPTPVNWTPPPLEMISTVILLDVNRTAIQEIMTDSKGRFTITLAPGTYYLRVKESRIPAETGPYVVRSGQMLTAEAHFDSGMR